MKLLHLSLMLSVLVASCKEQEKVASSSVAPSESDIQVELIPTSFVEALDNLDQRYSEKERSDFLNAQGEFTFLHRGFGMRLRNDWGLWKGSALKDYFSARGIAHADWISAAIFEGWRERITKGSFDEEAIIAKYAAIEKRWRSRQDKSEDSVEDVYPFSSD